MFFETFIGKLHVSEFVSKSVCYLEILLKFSVVTVAYSKFLNFFAKIQF